MSMNRHMLLFHGTQMREGVLTIYRNYSRHEADAIVRRMIYEIGEAVSDLNCRKDAGQLLYAAADACTAKLPVEDFRLPMPQESVVAAIEPVAANKTSKPWSAMNSAQKTGFVFGSVAAILFDRFNIGFALGFYLGRPL